LKLCFFRHGIAVRKGLMADSKRPLTSEGRAKTKKAARGLQRLELKPDLVLASPLARARQTAEILVQELRLKKAPEPCEALEPNGLLHDLFVDIRKRGRVKCALLVGHEPGQTRMVSELISGSRNLRIELKKAGACCLEVDRVPPTRKAILLWLLTSKQLRKLG
jgi:phosphohistidine phosphatase